jgi:hypothetical protein
MQELDVTNVRELEDFLINECMYAVGFLPAAFHSFYNHDCFFFALFFFFCGKMELIGLAKCINFFMVL